MSLKILRIAILVGTFNLYNADKICAAQKFMLKVHMGRPKQLNLGNSCR